MVEVEHSAHQEEREVVKTPAQEQPATTVQKLVDIDCKQQQ